MNKQKIAKELVKIAKSLSSGLSENGLEVLQIFREHKNKKAILKFNCQLEKVGGDNRWTYEVFLRYQYLKGSDELVVREVLRNGRGGVPIGGGALGLKFDKFLPDTMKYKNDEDFYNEVVVPYNNHNKKQLEDVLNEWVGGNFRRKLTSWIEGGYFKVTEIKVKLL